VLVRYAAASLPARWLQNGRDNQPVFYMRAYGRHQ
jgi:hypothetical protein